MTALLASFVHINPNPYQNPKPNLFQNKGFMAVTHTPSSSSLRLEALLRPHNHRASSIGRFTFTRGFGGSQVLSIDRRRSKNRWIVSLASSHEDSKHSKLEADEAKSQPEVGAEESQEAWKRMLESFKEQAVKMQAISQEAYELYSEKALVILKEKTEQLQIQAEKASEDFSILAKEISEEGKEYLSTAAEHSPEEVKDIVETFASSTDDLKEISKVRDFYLGIPYGTFLSAWGFLSFMLTGSISAIRFGVILGGILLALSVSSLRSWKRGESSAMALKGQAAIAGIIFLRDLRLLSLSPSLPSSLTTFISGSMVVFYLYRIISDGVPKKGPSAEQGQEN